MLLSPDDVYQELFIDVQQARLFVDSKTFCDVLPREYSPEEILEIYRKEKLNSTFNLNEFVHEYFVLPNSTCVIDDNKKTIDQHCQSLWPLLTRSIAKNRFSSMIDVPHPFVVPGGRFREFYYWDTYFTMLGLIRSNQKELIENILANFAYLMRTIGHIPNANRSYFLGRSQPPFFVLMTELANQTDKYRNELELEYQFWMNKRSVTLDNGETILNRYFDDLYDRPRPESYREDVETAKQAKTNDIYAHVRAAAESGWDFSSRWMDDETDLSTIRTADILPIDLNCLLYRLETVLGKINEAERRRQAIQKYFWSNELQFFVDYNFIRKKQNDRLTLAALYPLWLDLATVEQAKQVAQQVEPQFLHDGGVVTTISKKSTQQWDSPNGWAPLQYITYRALLKTPNCVELACTIRDRWMSLNERAFKETGKMMEKYDVVNVNRPAGGGEYENQDGFGWTNGVYLEMLFDRQQSN